MNEHIHARQSRTLLLLQKVYKSGGEVDKNQQRCQSLNVHSGEGIHCV